MIQEELYLLMREDDYEPSRVEIEEFVEKFHEGMKRVSQPVVKPYTFNSIDTLGYFEEKTVIEKEGKCGFINRNGKVVIPFAFDFVDNFVDDFARVKKDGKWSIFDLSGKQIVPLIYDFVGEFINGLAAIKKDDKWGFIDTSGKEISPPIFESVGNFGQKSREDKLKDFLYEKALVKMNDDIFFYINTKGEWIMSDEYLQLLLSEATVQDLRDIEENYILDNSEQYELLAMKFYELGELELSEKTYLKVLEQCSDKDSFVDFAESCAKNIAKTKYKNAKNIAKYKYSEVSDFTINGFARVWLLHKKCGFKCGLIDKDNKVVIPLIYDFLTWWDSDESLLCASNQVEEDKMGILDTTGKEVIPFYKYDYIGRLMEGSRFQEYSGVFIVGINEKYGIADKMGNLIIPCNYEYIYPYSIVSGNTVLFEVKLNGEYFYINLKNERVEK